MDINEKWAAITSSDPSCDGKFFYGVKSTGIYCRPSCKSKNPVRQNVLFFNSREEAELAGFRPCKRCRPDLPSYDPAAETAESAKILIDRAFADRVTLQGELNSLGVSRRRLAGLFEKRYAMSPEQYLNQVRFSHAKGMLAEGKRITDVAFAVGLETPSAFAVFFKKQAGISPSEYMARQAAEAPYCFCQTPIGTARISEDESGIAGIRFVDWEPSLETAPANGIYLEDAAKQFQEYFAKKRRAFDVPLSLHGSEFQRTVWRQIQMIPYGETRSYQDIALCIGNPKAARAVGMANNRNPVLIMVPCHRVVGKGNRIVGYAGGIERKQFLLDLEVAND